MGHEEGSSHTRKGKHLNWEERIQIETLQREGLSSGDIGQRLGRPARTIRREIRRGWVIHRLERYRVQERYSADRGQAVYEDRMSSRCPCATLDERLVEHLRERIVEDRESPEAVAGRMKRDGLEYAVCAKTIYNLIDRGRVPGVTNESLWEKRKRRKGRKTLHRRRKRAVAPGRGIENRPERALDREEAGHWEIDLVVSGKGHAAALLTLTERKTRKQILRRLKDKSRKAVVRALNGIERQMGPEAFRTAFKSITADNGSEFLDYEAIERSVSGGIRTCIYYAHPYSSWERGSNENANRMVRRFIPKGCDIAKYTRRQIQAIEDWLNNYPRKILDFETAEERFIRELAA